MSGSGVQNVSFGFAHGVGLTNSTSITRAPRSVQHPLVTAPVEPSSIAPLLSKL